MEKIKYFIQDYWRVICGLLIIVIVISAIFIVKSRKMRAENNTVPTGSDISGENMELMEDEKNGDIWTIQEEELRTEPEDIWTIPENELNN